MAYQSSDASTVYPKIQPAIASAHKLLFGNSNISPNLITCIGLGSIIALMNITLWGCGGFNTIIGIPFFAPLCAICIAVYFLADCIDGLQGKKVGMYEHPLAEIFDHGTDAVAVVGIILATLHLLKASNWAAALLMFCGLSTTLLVHNEHMATGTFNFPAGIGNVTNLLLGTIGLFLACSILPLPSIHIPWTNFNLAAVLALGSLAATCLNISDTYRRSQEAVMQSLPGIAVFAVALNTWWWSQPHFLNRFTFMGTVTPMLCYIWTVILSKFTDSRLSPQSALVPLAFSLLNIYLHSTVKGFFFTCGIFLFADFYFPLIVARVSRSLGMSHWWGVQLDNDARRATKTSRREGKRQEKMKEKEVREQQAKQEQEEREKRMIEDEKQGFLTVGKNGRVVHPTKKENEQQNAPEQTQQTAEKDKDIQTQAQNQGNEGKIDQEKAPEVEQQQQTKTEQEPKAEPREQQETELKTQQENAQQPESKPHPRPHAQPEHTERPPRREPGRPEEAQINLSPVKLTSVPIGHENVSKTVDMHSGDNAQAPEGDDSSTLRNRKAGSKWDTVRQTVQ